LISFTSENGKCEVVAETEGAGIYLDNDSLIALARYETATLRKRFVDALHAKATLLFSWTNAIEVSGPQYASADAVRAFLDSIGPHWVPLELNPWEVVKREATGPAAQGAVSMSFMENYFKDRIHDLSQGNRVLDLSSEAFFRLGAVVDWVQEHRDKIQADAVGIDDALRTRLTGLRTDYERDAASLDRLLPPGHFDEHSPATFVLVHLQRLLVLEAKGYQFKKGDGLDLCHAVLAAAYGGLITLDKHWKRRVRALPDSAKLARTYYRAEIDQLVTTMEGLASK
jgi:hypothetical protein